MAITETRQYREPFVEAAGLGVTNEGLRLLKQTLPTTTYTASQFVAGQSQLEQDAAKAAADLGQLTGTGAGTGAGSIASYMSPYQEQVIDASLAALDREQARGLGALRNRAVQAGAFGGGRESAMTAYEMMLSESQERMLMIIEPEKEKEAKLLFDKWGLDFATIGVLTDTNHIKVNHENEKKADIPLEIILLLVFLPR